ncbi:MAG: hypothetical protein ACQEQH_04450 [Bacillota bacterium]
MKKIIYILLTLILVLTINLSADAQDVRYIEKERLINELNLKSSIEIIDKKFQDVTGDGINDQIFLIGDKPGGIDSIFYAPLEVAVYDTFKKNFHKTTYRSLAGYEPKLALYDFTGDQTKDIFIKANSGGSGGIYNHLIVNYSNNDLNIIFDNYDNKGLDIKGRYMDGFKAELFIEELNREITLDLSFNKDKYIDEKIYDYNGKLLREINPNVYPYSNLTPMDYDLDNTFELRGTQRLVGAYGADSIGKFHTILKYDRGWNVKEIEISTYLKKYNPSISKNGNLSYEIQRNAVTSGNQRIYYPEIKNLPQDVSSTYINRQLEKIVEPFFSKEEELQIDFEATKKTDQVLSIVYQGYQKYENGEYELLYSFNYDLENNRRLTTKNILKDGKNVKEKVNQIIRQSIQDKSLREEFPGISDWMGMYITDSNLVLYYLKNDFEVKHTKVYIPLKDIAQYLSIDIDYDKEETEIFFIEVD